MVNISRQNFSEWYNQVLEHAEVVDIRYPVKGMPVYTPFGFSLLKKIFDKLEHMFNTKDHKQCLFPLMVAEEEFKKESEHIKGFGSEVFITGDDERKLVIRPTSETSMYPMFKLWIQSHTQLPFKVHQTCCIYRKETKATRPLIRGREVFWNEGHTIHVSYEDAKKHHEIAIGIYSELFESLGIPFKILVRPEYDKFPGAVYSVAFDCVLPDGKLLQIGTVHHLGQNFSKAYGFKVLMPDNTRDYPHQLCYGVSMRVLAATISIHGDERGLVFPTWLSEPVFVIVPVVKKGFEEKVNDFCSLIERKINVHSKCLFDLSERTSGEKHFRWELKGIPFRIEIGPAEAESEEVLIKTRYGDKIKLKLSELDGSNIAKLCSDFDRKLVDKALAVHKSFISEAFNVNDFKGKKGFVKAGWCEDKGCEAEIRERYFIEARGYEYNSALAKKERACVVCGKPGFEYYFGKPY